MAGGIIALATTTITAKPMLAMTMVVTAMAVTSLMATPDIEDRRRSRPAAMATIIFTFTVMMAAVVAMGIMAGMGTDTEMATVADPLVNIAITVTPMRMIAGMGTDMEMEMATAVDMEMADTQTTTTSPC